MYMSWEKVLDKWEKGNYPKFIKMKKSFIWKTSPYFKNSQYKEECIDAPLLNILPNYSPFISKFKKNNKYSVNFANLSGDTILIVPLPQNSKNYSNIYTFNKNASITQKKAFWKKVAIIAKKEQKKHGIIWISTHGYGVSWLHVRISKTPKYYGTSKLKKPPTKKTPPKKTPPKKTPPKKTQKTQKKHS
jgi:hypothetical protein